MNYFDMYAEAKRAYLELTHGTGNSQKFGNGLEIVRIPFMSAPQIQGGAGLDRPLSGDDARVRENSRFDYFLVLPPTRGRVTDAVLLLHGLNEKSWEKYLPWAARIAESSGKAVVLFPIAFHMNRAPAEWSDPRSMMRLAKERREMFPDVRESSFANAALSSRLQFGPDRFLFSGLQTYGDIIELIDGVRRGEHPFLGPSAQVDVFGYSIGAFLSEILMLQNPGGRFDSSKAFLFCGGATLGGMSPVSRYIMDSRAGEELSGYYADQCDPATGKSALVGRILERLQSLGELFLSMLFLERSRGYREARLDDAGSRIRAVALRKDEVVPYDEVAATLQSSAGAARVEVMDLPHPYTHVQPFPLLDAFRAEIERSFDAVFARAAEQLA